MTYETKVILSLIARTIGNAKTIKEAYTAVVEAANVEGFLLPSYEEFKAKQLKEQSE